MESDTCIHVCGFRADFVRANVKFTLILFVCNNNLNTLECLLRFIIIQI